MAKQPTTKTKASRASKSLGKPKASKTKSAPVVIPEDVAEVVIDAIAPVSVPVDVSSSVVPPSSSRLALDRDSLRVRFEEFNTLLDNEWKLSKEDRSRNVKLQVWKHLQTELNKLKNVALKSARKKTRTNTNPHSGFYKPVNISPDLATFIEVDRDTLVSRLDVTKRICQYIKENGLQNPADKRIILPDTKLGSLLTYNTEEGPLTYFVLQKLLQPHFQKSVPVAV